MTARQPPLPNMPIPDPTVYRIITDVLWRHRHHPLGSDREATLAAEIIDALLDDGYEIRVSTGDAR